jgi:probable HAF family extracellular repeat protein
MPLRSLRYSWIALALATNGCVDEDPVAPRRPVEVSNAPSMTVTYTNGSVTMTDLGTPPGAAQSLALGINDVGVIFGHVRTSAHPPCAPQLAMCNVGAIWGSYLASPVIVSNPTNCVSGPDASSIWSVNNVGVAVGFASCQGSRGHGFVRDATGGVRRLPGLIGSDDNLAEDINDFGVAVGRLPVGYSNGFPINRAGMWNVSGSTITVTNLDPGSAFESLALAINNAGTIVGYKTHFTGAFRAFVRPPSGALDDIGTLPGDIFSLAAGISASGTVVGYSQSASAIRRAFVWTAATGMQPVGALAGTQSFARGVNSDGVIVGSITTASGQSRAFAWKSGVMIDLGVLPGHTMSDATAINERGEIVGTSCCAVGGFLRAVRWTIGTPGETPPGEDVSVQPIDETTGQPSPVQITFDNVTGGGTTTVTSGTLGGNVSPPPPSGFRLGMPATYYNVETTASFAGSITLCFNYTGVSYKSESLLKLGHYENGTWTDVTTSLDIINNVICGTVTSLSPFLVAELNVSPVVTAIDLPSAPIPVGTSVSVTASFTDGNVGDTHTASIVWDDGATTALSVTEATGMATATHTYTVPGVYMVQVSVSDGDLTGTRSSSDDEPAYIVVYDPTSGYVTGGGWIDSPSGSCQWNGCASDGSTIGKATFGFVSRYKTGATAPSGNTEFQFKAGGLAFSSTSYQWLVVAGARAQYKGEGEISGSTGSYGFLLTAIDGALDGTGTDRFRIKIWDKTSGVVVYDNKMGSGEDSGDATALGGGSVVIHR